MDTGADLSRLEVGHVKCNILLTKITLQEGKVKWGEYQKTNKGKKNLKLQEKQNQSKTEKNKKKNHLEQGQKKLTKTMGKT